MDSTGNITITDLEFAEESMNKKAWLKVSTKPAQGIKWLQLSCKKTKQMTNSANGIQKEIKVKGPKLGMVTSFKYLGATIHMKAKNKAK